MNGKLGVLAICTLAMAGCGGGGEDDGSGGPAPGPGGSGWTSPPAPPAPPAAGSTQTGVFKDANVRGVSWQSGGLSGVTGADGKFQYVVGQNVTFSVGAVALGTFAGQPFITPLHLPTVATNVGDQIDNRIRFLQMLDLDGNPDNGIEISDNALSRAASWAQVDFTTAPANLATALADIRADAMSADGGTHALPTADAARDHFARTVRCAYSGLFRGRYSGADTGIFAIVTYADGRMRGLGYSTVDDDGFLLEKTSGLLLSFTPGFVAGTGTNGASFSGEYRSPSEMTGSWVNGADTGTFVGSRSGGSESAVYRISGFQFPVGTALIMSFEVDGNNVVTGSVIDLDDERDGVPISLTGTLAGTTFTANATGGQYTVTGTFNPSAPAASRQLSGTLRDNIKGRDVNLQLPGCKLN